MSKLSSGFIESLLWIPPDLTRQSSRYYLFNRIAAWVACLSHGSWVVVFALNNLTLMAYYNVVVTALFALFGFLWYRSQCPKWFTYILFFGEIPMHALLGTLYTGLGTMFWMFGTIPAIACLLTPQFSWPKKVAVCLGLVVFSCATGVWAIFAGPWNALSQGWVVYLFVTNTLSISSAFVLYLGLNQYLVEIAEEGLEREFQRAEGLLRNILPDPIALRLKDGERVIANEHREVSVIFADIVGFTEASSRLSPGELVETLNLVFSELDNLADHHGAEKIKTIGDAYMAVVGAPEDTGNHAEIAVDLAVDMLRAVKALNPRTHFDVQMRIGINSGPVVAGVIGKRKFAYDLWGDAVNIASRMESLGEPGEITITEDTAALLPVRFVIKPEGFREIKGKGPTPVFSIHSRG